jgi:SAM-dependent methyltransferase
MDQQFSREIQTYYDQTGELERLDTGVFQLEFIRTKDVIDRFLPPAAATILDIGGGPGKYSSWLAQRGYEVHLLDPVRKHVEQARALDARIADCLIGDARSLPFQDQFADALLLLGPLYHLPRAEDRMRVLSEARRVLKPGGLLFAASISRFASALDGLTHDLFADPEFGRIVERDLSTGVHENQTDNPMYFTTAKFHRPEELEAEMSEGDFHSEGVFGLEGPGWMFADFQQRWGDSRKREDLLRVAHRFEREPSVRGMSAHLLGVARRPQA